MYQNQTSFIHTLSKIHNSKIYITDYLNLIFKNNQDVHVYWKDKNYILQGCNHNMLRIYGDNVIGKTDFEFLFDESDATLRRTLDQEIIENKKTFSNSIVTYHTRSGRCALWSTTKLPFYDENKNIIGIAGFAIPIYPNEVTSLYNTQLLNFHPFLKNEKTYYIRTHHQVIKLTPKQAECLTHLSMGKTLKQIARLIDREVSTVESHIDSLKHKLSVYSLSELIDCFWKNPIKWF